MTFLKKLGTILAKGTALLVGLGPLFPQYTDVVAKAKDIFSGIANIVVTVEGIGAALLLSGVDKLKAATPLVAQLILQSDLMIKKKIDNPILFQAGVEKITSGMVDILNSLKDEIVTTPTN